MWFVGLCWGVTAIASCLAALLLIVAVTGANGAPQEAAAGAICAAMAVIPYVFTRAIEAMTTSSAAVTPTAQPLLQAKDAAE